MSKSKNPALELGPELRFVKKPILYVGRTVDDGVSVSVVKQREFAPGPSKGVRLTITIDGSAFSVIMRGSDAVNLASGIQSAAYECGEGM